METTTLARKRRCLCCPNTRSRLVAAQQQLLKRPSVGMDRHCWFVEDGRISWRLSNKNCREILNRFPCARCNNGSTELKFLHRRRSFSLGDVWLQGRLAVAMPKFVSSKGSCVLTTALYGNHVAVYAWSRLATEIGTAMCRREC